MSLFTGRDIGDLSTDGARESVEMTTSCEANPVLNSRSLEVSYSFVKPSEVANARCYENPVIESDLTEPAVIAVSGSRDSLSNTPSGTQDVNLTSPCTIESSANDINELNPKWTKCEKCCSIL